MPGFRIFAFYLFTLLLAAMTTGPANAQTVNAGSPEFFETKIRPILANNCYGCHTNSAMGGLRLDSLESLKKGGKRGPALVPGDPDKSLLIQAIQQTGDAPKMPMGGKLKDAEINEIVQWVKAGATWPKSEAPVAATSMDGKYVITAERKNFWSFLPLANPEPPKVADPKWAKTPIDRFVLAKLEAQGLKPVGLASKQDLIRRATLDLTGLLPTPEEISAFENDKSPDAFAKVVDRLLASPHYGERWGRVWLDVARYGEDDYRSLNPNPRGYRPYPNAWAYRDWVIQAFNDDLPYDQFVKAQLAGDLMDKSVRYKMLPATGFLGLGPWYYDNGSAEVTRADERHDRVDAVTRGFLGLTVACARCHDHKYDPIPQTDYYGLAGVFYNTIYEEYPRAPRKTVEAFEKIADDLDNKQKLQQETQQNLSTELSRVLALQTSNYLMGVWEVTGKQKKDIAQVVETRKLDYELLDRWIKYMEKPTDKYHNKDAWQAMMKNGGGNREEAKKLADKFQQDIEDVMLAKNEIDAENKVMFDKDLDGLKPKKRTDKPSNFVTNKDFNPGSWLQLESLPEQRNNFWIEIFQRELKDAEDPQAVEGGKRQTKPGVLLFRGWGLESRLGPEDKARLKTMQDDVAELKKKLDPHYPFIHGVMDSPKPEDIKLALRGNPENLGDVVPRHFLTVFATGNQPTPLNQGSGRMQLAELILKQPIAMRVIVNRIWKEHFGTGITDTPSNFGFGGERPTNPELLDYLASYFVKNGMSIKKLHREIMLSTVYQLSTEMNQADFDKDSGNRYYWRTNRKRMEAEQIRDSILQVAGNLDDQLGGPSADLTPDFLRRTVYGKVSRYKTDEYLKIFDFPTPSISAEKRFTTTVPLQRLFLMNSDFVQLEAEAFAKRVASEPNSAARIRKMYLLAYGREPSPEEVKLGLEYIRTEPMKEYEENKNKGKDDKGAGKKSRGGDEGKELTEAKPATDEETDATDGAGVDGAAMPMGMGMMAGVPGFGGPGGGKRQQAKAAEIKYDATAWGRYAKVLLSSSEFIFIN